MFAKIVIGVDERPGARDAIELSRRLAGPGAELTLAHVYPNELRSWRGSSGPYESIERDDSAALLARLRDDAGLAAELRSVGAPTVGRGLHLLAEATGADLLVVGSSTRGMFARVRLSDDTRASLNGAPCAVAVAPIGYADSPKLMREIGVGYNGSAESLHALAVARDVAGRWDARVSAFEAVALSGRAFAGGAPPISDQAIEELVEQAHERVSGLEGIDPHAAYGDPAEELAWYSASLDLLVVGSRDYGPFGRLFHGSTSQQLARAARCPLLVLTRAARAQDAALPGLDQPVLEGVANELGSSSDS